MLALELSDYINVTRSGGHGSAVEEAVTPFRFFLWGQEGRKGLHYVFMSRDLGVNCAFGVYAQIDGKEYDLGPLTMKTGLGLQYYWDYWPDAPKVPLMDIVLRSSGARARETIDLRDAWEGELTFRGIPVIMNENGQARFQMERPGVR